MFDVPLEARFLMKGIWAASGPAAAGMAAVFCRQMLSGVSICCNWGIAAR